MARAGVGTLVAILLAGCSTPAEVACPAGQSPCNGSCIESTVACPGAASDMAVPDQGSGCNVPSDCPAPATACQSNSCSAGACGTTNAAAGMPCSDSGGTVCDGNGSCVPGCSMPADCPNITTTACQANLCNPMVSLCMLVDAPPGLPCSDNGGTLCDGNGACVACLMASDCAPQTTTCLLNSCDPTAHTCGSMPAAPGTSCSDSGGTMCDGNGNCLP